MQAREQHVADHRSYKAPGLVVLAERHFGNLQQYTQSTAHHACLTI